MAKIVQPPSLLDVTLVTGALTSAALSVITLVLTIRHAGTPLLVSAGLTLLAAALTAASALYRLREERGITRDREVFMQLRETEERKAMSRADEARETGIRG